MRSKKKKKKKKKEKKKKEKNEGECKGSVVGWDREGHMWIRSQVIMMATIGFIHYLARSSRKWAVGQQGAPRICGETVYI